MTDPTTNEAQALGARLRAAREQAGLPQEGVAAAIGVPRSGISDMELGKRGVDVLELRRLATLYGIDAAALVYDPCGRPAAAAWEPDAVHRDGGWYTLPLVLRCLIENEAEAYERDGHEIIVIAEGPDTDGVPHLGVWLRADDDRYAGLPMFEVTLAAGPMRLRVYAAKHRDVLALLRELTPLVKDLHLATLAARSAAQPAPRTDVFSAIAFDAQQADR